MGTQVVHHDDVSVPQLRAQHLIEIGEEDVTVGGGFDGHRGQHAAVIHRAHDGKHLPVTAGHSIVDTLAARRTRIQPRHLRRNTALVQVNQVFRQDRADMLDERFTPLPVGFRVTLGGVDRLFLSRRSSFLSTRHNCVMLNL